MHDLVMWEDMLLTLSVYLSAMVKFIFGPIGGKAAGLHVITTMVVTTAGMMTTVVAFTYFGEFIRKKILDRFFRKATPKEDLSKTNNSFFKKYGLAGIAILTPVILTPIGGTLLAVSVSSNREKIILYMFISACVWSVILTLAVYLGYDAILDFIHRLQPV